MPRTTSWSSDYTVGHMEDSRAVLPLWSRGRCLWMLSEGWWSPQVYSPPPEAGPERLVGPASQPLTQSPQHLVEEELWVNHKMFRTHKAIKSRIIKQVLGDRLPSTFSITMTMTYPIPGCPGHWSWWCVSRFPPHCRGRWSCRWSGRPWTGTPDSPGGLHRRPEEPHSHS